MTTKKVAVKSIDPFYASSEFKKYFKAILSRRGYTLTDFAYVINYDPKYFRSQTYANTKVSLHLIYCMKCYLDLSSVVYNKLKKLANEKNLEIDQRKKKTGESNPSL